MAHLMTSQISRTCQLLLLVLAIRSNQSARALEVRGGMTTLEVEMVERGSFLYASLPESGKKLLFEKYLLKYSRKVKLMMSSR